MFANPGMVLGIKDLKDMIGRFLNARFSLPLLTSKMVVRLPLMQGNRVGNLTLLSLEER